MEEIRTSGAMGTEDVLNSVNPYRYTSQIPNGKGNNNINAKINGNNTLTNMINKSIAKNMNQNGGNNGMRNSMRLSMRNSLPRSSIGPQLSQPTPQLNSTQNSTYHNTSRDPRPLRDKNFQNLLQHEIFSYLSDQKFDVETNHPISLKSLRQPTQKDFIYMFKWLYLRLDPGYVFTKSLEHEVYSILRTIHYPYLATINKSQISAVGGSNWPKFIGMLHWLVVINKKLDECLEHLDMSINNQVTQDITVLNQPLKTVEQQEKKQEKYELMVERLFIDYITESYKSFLRLEDDYEPYLHDLELTFQRFVHIIETDIAQLTSTNEQLSVECETIVAKNYDLKTIKEKNVALEHEYKRLSHSVQNTESKSKEWPEKLKELEAEIEKKKKDIRHVSTQIDDLNAILKKKNVSGEEIENKNRESDTISKNLDTVSSRLDQFTGLVRQQRLETESVYKNLQDTLKQYKSATEGLIIARKNVGDKIPESSIQLTLPSDLMSEEKIGLTVEELIGEGKSFTESAKKNLHKIAADIQERITSIQSENSKLQESLEDLRNEITVKNEELELLEQELSSVKTEHEEFRQESQSQLLSQNITIEKLERKIQNARVESQQKISKIERDAEQTKLELEELKIQQSRQRLELHNKIIDLIEYVSNFKIKTQSSLESLQNATARELERLKNEP
ncbi:putative kinetochore protein NDC80 [Kluyveromyces marxianus]